MDLDGFIKLDDQQIKEAQAQADISTKLLSAGVAAEVTWQAAVKAALENVALFDKINWDAEAHSQLQTIRNLALQKARELEHQSEKLRANLGRVTWLMAGGGDWDRIRDGWLAFEFLRGHLPFDVAMKAATIKPLSEAYDRAAWLHSKHAVPPAPEQHDPGTLMRWARQQNCYPVFDGPAWQWLAAFLKSLDDAAAVAATEIQVRVDAAAKAALELEQRDWDRLKTPA